MATGSVNVANGEVTNDAEFRAWAQAIHDVLTASGLTQTADAGQINIATALRPAINAFAGYEVWRFNDALQATAPLFVKLRYGISGIATRTSLEVTVGKGSDGNGTLTGVMWGPFLAQRTGAQAGAMTTFASYGDSALALAYNVGLALPVIFVLERVRDDNGDPTGEGVFIGSYGTANFVPQWASIAYDGTYSEVVAQPAMLTPAGGGGTLYKGETLASPLYPLIGYARHPSRAVVSQRDADAAPAQVFTVPIDGVARTFRCVGLAAQALAHTRNAANNNVSGAPVAVGLSIRYE